MSTVFVTVDKANHALMLAEWLRKIQFVKDVSVEIDKSSSGNVEAVQKALDAIQSKRLFSEIIDPVAYQRQLRDEWR
jgi:hypothetical protein